jgi:hypothetical protein
MISGSGNVFLTSLSVTLLIGEWNRREAEKAYANLLIFYAKILLCELACEFNQDPIRPALRVPEQGYDDVTVAEVKDCLGSVSRESSQVVEEGNLYAVPAMRVPLLCRGQISLQDPNKILNIHRCLFLLLIC